MDFKVRVENYFDKKANLSVAVERFKAMVDGLELEEKDKFPLVR